MRVIDLRSDTVTRPSAPMRRAMAEAEVGDDAYGEDPTVRELEERTADLLGLPAALFVPSGTQANQIAIGVHCRPGDELIAESESHCLNFETGGVSALWGVQPRPIASDRGIITPEQIKASIRPTGDHLPRSRLLCLENTHNHGGGTVWPIDRFRQVVHAARDAHLSIHLDGARLFNAQVASGIGASEYAGLADSASVCFSKGLGAPAGSALCGSVDFIREGRRLRRRLGGGMRQAGILAAGARYALLHNIQRLAEDHANARRLAVGLSAIRGIDVDPSRVETNMVFAELPFAAAESVARLRSVGVWVNAEGRTPKSIRFVCHLDVAASDIDQALARIQRAVSGG
jgi:threonine aldolase